MENNFLKTEPIGKLLFRLSFPMVLSMLVNSIYNIVDSIYLSRIGTEAITSLSIIFPVQNLTVAVSVGLGVGVSSLLSRLMGAQKLNESEEAATQGMVLSVINGIIFIIIGLFLIQFYIGFYANPGSLTYEYALAYGQIILCFSLPYLLYLVLEKVFQALGWMWITMIGMLTGSISNIILDPMFIFGFKGIPALGVSGAAIATILGQIIALTFFVLVYLFSDFPVRFHLKYIKLKWFYIKQIYNVGIPSAVTLVLPSVLVSGLNRLLISFSETAVAVLGIYYKIQTFFYLPLSGLTMGLRPIASYNYGAKDYSRVKAAFRTALLTGLIILTIGFLILQIFPGPILELFQPSQDLYNLAQKAFRVISIGFIPSVVTLILNGMFEALGWGQDSLKLSLLRQVILVFPIAFLFSFIFGMDGVFWSIPVSEILTALYSLNLIKSKLIPALQ